MLVATEIIKVEADNQDFWIKAVKDIDSLLQLVKEDDDVPFWAVLWPAALGIARFLWREPDLMEKKVLELGAGLGLAGIVASAKGAQVCQTDFVPEALDFCTFNCQQNNVTTQRVIADWRNFEIEETFDVIIGSDILYEPTLHPYIKDIFQKNLRPNGRVILSDPGRKDAEGFVEQLRVEGLTVKTDVYEVEDAGLLYKVNIYTVLF